MTYIYLNFIFFTLKRYHHTYIFDEDPLHQLVRFEKITTKDLRIVAKGLQDLGQSNDAQSVYTLAEHLKSGIGFLMTDISPINFQDPELVATVISSKNEKLSGDVFSFLCNDASIKYIIKPEDSEDPTGEKCIHCVNYRRLLDDKKYIILSATVDEWIYKKLYGDRIEVIDLSNVEIKGKIVQFSNRSFSRSAMNNEKRLSTVNKFLQSLNTITFLKYKDKVVNSLEDIHFGKVEGFNSLSGEDFKVAGTFHLSRSHYLLFAKFLGIQLNSLDLVLRREMVNNNGFRFNFFTFENPDLRRIQFYFIEKELKQAVGRARLLDNENTVFVFSEYPIPRAKQFCLKEAPQVEQEYLAQVA